MDLSENKISIENPHLFLKRGERPYLLGMLPKLIEELKGSLGIFRERRVFIDSQIYFWITLKLLNN